MSEKSMAMTTDKKLYIAVGVLAVMGVVLYIQNQKQKAEAATYTAEAVTAELPKLEFNDEAIKKIDKVVITQPAGDAGAAKDVTLEKKGETWQVTKPVTAKANDANVKSLLDNLKTLKVTESVSPSKDSYAEHDLTDDKALHAVFYKGAEVAADFYFGKSGGRGQMTRVKDKEGAFAIKGYSAYLYARDLKDWRDREVFKFEDTKVKTVDIVNEHGTFAFVKDGENWKGKFKKAKEPAGKEIARFDQEKVKDLLRAYKALSADGFADGKSAADTGLDKPSATVTIVLDDGAKKTLEVGKTAEGTAKWARASGVSEIISIGSWNAEWATAEVSKFQKPVDGGAAPTPPPAMPEMPGMPGMPPGMGDPHGGMH